MYKKILSYFSILFALITVVPYGVFAADTQPNSPQLSEQYICLEAVQIPGTHVATIKTSTGFTIPTVDGTGNPLKVLIFETLVTEKGPVSTTGNAQTDAAAGLDPTNLSYLQTNYKYNQNPGRHAPYGLLEKDMKTGHPNPFNSTGSIDLDWSSETEQAVGRRVYAKVPFLTKASTGGDGGLQQATWTMTASTDNCTIIKWDPYGRVFDTVSLEPISGTSVTLYNVANGIETMYVDQQNTVKNPSNPTHEDGWYSFVVPTGFYKVKPSLSTHTFASPDFGKTLKTNKYTDLNYGETFEEKPGGAHLDIPMTPKNPANVFVGPVKNFWDAYPGTTKDIAQIITGKLSHPLTKVSVFGIRADGKKTDVLAMTEPDKDGIYRLEIPVAKLQNDVVTKYDVVVEKIDPATLKSQAKNGLMDRVVTMIGSMVKAVSAQQQSYTISVPVVPRYVEGYAYDGAGKTIANAQVGVYPTGFTTPYSTTSTDSTGYFKMTSEYLPGQPYYLKFTSATGAVTVQQPAQYIAKNEQLIVQKKVNPYEYKDASGNTKPPVSPLARVSTSPSGNEPGSNGTGAPGANGPSGITTGGETPGSYSPSNTSSTLLLVVIVLIFIGVAGTVLTLYALKKKQSEPTDIGGGMQ